MSYFLCYQTFTSPELAQPLLQLLEQHHIAFETTFARASFNGILGTTSTPQFEIKLLPADFERARSLEADSNHELYPDLPADHYLFRFSDEELFTLLARPDEWSSFDVTLAEQLLRERGHDVTPELAAFLRQYRVAELSVPERSQWAWIFWGYLLALSGGVLGMLLGWHMAQHRKTLPNGQQVAAFSAHDRLHGRCIMLLGAVAMAGWLMLALAPEQGYPR